MAIERVISCRVQSLNESGVIHGHAGGRMITGISVDLVDDGHDGDRFRGTVEVPPTEQPKIGDHYIVSIMPESESERREREGALYRGP
jgi:hypothetical protein